MTDKPKVLGLLKFGSSRTISRFREEGLMYCQPLEYFRRLESDELRSDPSEGLTLSFRADAVTLRIGLPGEETTINAATGLTGRVEIREHQTSNVNIFCCYAITSRHLGSSVPIDVRNFAFGDRYAVIRDWVQFQDRLFGATKAAGLALNASLVDYVDEDTYSGEIGVFRKFSRFAHQSEYRFAFNPGQPHPLQLRLGSIVDITSEGSLSDLNSLIRFEQTPARQVDVNQNDSG